ncbi:hypothetical protein niasHT_009612 [Heterodera trifolii]|uniref:Uncharacterized protein n=1 Tax=Heterodera trifolii TaxID=157864 RepID=A0ABD2LWX4_9BILA
MFSRFAAELDITLDSLSLTYLASQSNYLTGNDIKRSIQLSLNEAHFRSVCRFERDENDIFERIGRGLGNNFVVAGQMADGASRSGARHCSLLNPHAKKMSFVTCLPCFGRRTCCVAARRLEGSYTRQPKGGHWCCTCR